MTKKNYELLRPFTIELFQQGQEACYLDGRVTDVRIVHSTEHTYEACVMTGTGLVVMKMADLRLAPLTWLSGKPVYKGDRLLSGLRLTYLTVVGYEEHTDCFTTDEGVVLHTGYCHWPDEAVPVSPDGVLPAPAEPEHTNTIEELHQRIRLLTEDLNRAENQIVKTSNDLLACRMTNTKFRDLLRDVGHQINRVLNNQAPSASEEHF